MGSVIENAKALGVDVAKKVRPNQALAYPLQALTSCLKSKIETSSPEEVDAAFVDAEFGPVADGSGVATPTGSAPLPASDGKAFAKPSRPGRKR